MSHKGNSGTGAWDSPGNHETMVAQVSSPVPPVIFRRDRWWCAVRTLHKLRKLKLAATF